MFKTRYKSHHDAENEYSSLMKRNRASKEELDAYLNDPEAISMKDNAIYIHIPFCDRICSFCNMNRKILDNTLDMYVEDLLTQIAWMGNHKYFTTHEMQAVYFGGGTPTVLSPSHFKQILGALRRVFKMIDTCEITCESTLHNLSNEHLEMFKVLGINRISIGIQTFQTEGRKFFNRTYNKEKVLERMKEIRRMFSGCLSIDKIYNYPGETKEMLLNDVQQIIDLDIDSISFYSLMIHKGSKLSEHLDVTDFSHEQDQEFHDIFVHTLCNTGDFEFLELTKIARVGRDQYRYMSIRNANGNTIPLGRGAGGKIDLLQVYNIDFNRVMIVKSENHKSEVANKIYGICQHPIINKNELRCLCQETMDRIHDTIDLLVKNGYLKDIGNTWVMSEKGIFYGNNIGGLLAREYLQSLDISFKIQIT